MKALTDFTSLIALYDYFIIDLWGTVHDGKRLFPGIREQLHRLKSLQKHVVFLSNAARPSSNVRLLLTKLELNAQHYDHLITSGDIFLADVAKTPRLQEPFYYMGDPILQASLLEALHAPTKSLEAAHYILCSAVPPNYQTILQEALAQGKLLVCVNPDLLVVDDGRTIPCAGSVAKEYAQAGGDVAYYGKPYETSYDYVFKILKHPPKEKVLMIGDGLYTDILGATKYGIDSLLVNTGVHRVMDLANPEHAMEQLSRDLGMEPTYFLETLGEK